MYPSLLYSSLNLSPAVVTITTSLIEKEEDCYDIITDNKYKYVLFEKETLNEESSDLVLVSLKSGDGHYFDSELQKYFILTNEVSRGTKHHE